MVHLLRKPTSTHGKGAGLPTAGNVGVKLGHRSPARDTRRATGGQDRLSEGDVALHHRQRTPGAELVGDDHLVTAALDPAMQRDQIWVVVGGSQV